MKIKQTNTESTGKYMRMAKQEYEGQDLSTDA